MMAAVTSKSIGSYDLESGTTSGEIPIENSDTENTLPNYKRQNRLQNIILVILCVAIVSLLCCLIEVVIRQLNKNPSEEQIERLWLLLCLVVVAFPPGKSFFKYFVSFLKDHQCIAEPTRQYVEWCLENCNHIQAAIRRNPPSTVEITAMKRLGTIVCRYVKLDYFDTYIVI